MIEDELKRSRRYMLKTIKAGGRELPCLTLDNVARVEAMILNDAAYLNTSNVDAGPSEEWNNAVTKYIQSGTMDFIKGEKGSTAYWMSQLRKSIKNQKAMLDFNIVFSAVCAVDRENSTHLNADNCGRGELTERILKYSPEDLFRVLRIPSPDYELIKVLSEKTNGGKGRNNFSFATKFCHYAAFYLFDDEAKDNFSIYDNVVKKALPLYISFYADELGWDKQCKKTRWLLENRQSYETGNKYGERYLSYLDTIDKLRKISIPPISRNGFDHLLWYYFKGR